MKNVNKNKGFTLIELIIVVIILGILAVTAAPKFLDVSSDAQNATLDGMRGALQSAVQLTRAKSRIDGNSNAEFDATTTPTVLLDGATIEIDFGIPAPTSPNVLDILDVSAGDWVALDDNANDHAATVARIWPAGKQGDAAEGSLDGSDGSMQDCYVQYAYTSSGGTGRPVITVVNTDC